MSEEEFGDRSEATTPRNSRAKKFPLKSIVVFLIGALFTLVIQDIYPWGKNFILGERVNETQIQEIDVVDYTGSLLSEYKITHTEPGACHSESFVSFDENIYRCSVYSGGLIDPCYVLQEKTAVVCLFAPWEKTLLKIELGDPIAIDPPDPLADKKDNRPWGLELRDPRHPKEIWKCLTLGGSTSPISGKQPYWWCDNGKTNGGRALENIKSSPGEVSKVSFFNPNDSGVVEAEISVIWYL